MIRMRPISVAEHVDVRCRLVTHYGACELGSYCCIVIRSCRVQDNDGAMRVSGEVAIVSPRCSCVHKDVAGFVIEPDYRAMRPGALALRGQYPKATRGANECCNLVVEFAHWTILRADPCRCFAQTDEATMA